MDDETAEVELVEQNLNKIRQISQRMSLYSPSLHIDSSSDQAARKYALQRMNEVTSNQEGTVAEEALDALGRLNVSIAFGRFRRINMILSGFDLVCPHFSFLTPLFPGEVGWDQSQEACLFFTMLVALGSTGSRPAGLDPQYSPFSRDDLATFLSLVKFLPALPLPATYPSHLAAAAILYAQRCYYAEMRGYRWISL
ncbi:hypothetical protein EDB86DRAFT_1450256 [Lactarius hatsudake]|nr:hypothetical protein EDB86DRAFT_1450256 [Lactarius hatsudake]